MKKLESKPEQSKLREMVIGLKSILSILTNLLLNYSQRDWQDSTTE